MRLLLNDNTTQSGPYHIPGFNPLKVCNQKLDIYAVSSQTQACEIYHFRSGRKGFLFFFLQNDHVLQGGSVDEAKLTTPEGKIL